ncbi:TerB family tellurite resistance protein [Kriegella sp. EG-1]|nr:TerB family tellurite resistance protein [Flavobacteriaceae bacterium EG-1]
MSTYEEKLSILSEMISFARVDKTIKESEYNFLLSVAGQLGVSRNTFEMLLKESSKHIIPKSQADRILQFHRLVLLMNVDEEQDEVEVSKIHNVGLGMGLPPSAIQQVLSIMHQYPNKIVPPKVLINIFKAHYN